MTVAPTLVLGIESSCDETAAAVVADGRRVLSNVVASQIELHAASGGVVPELASRAHVEKIAIVIRQALTDAGLSISEINAFAVTATPGLIGALLVGVEAAKGLALATGTPLVAVHHVRGHLYSIFLEDKDGRPLRICLTPSPAGAPPAPDKEDFDYPFIGLAVSGGHSSLALVEAPETMRLLGETRDDAAGEAYDKVAKLMGLGYPGGPIVDRLAAEGDPNRYDLPRPMLHSGDFDFSFSGLKTAVRLLVEREKPPAADETGNARFLRDLCASFQAAAIDVLLTKARKAARAHGARGLAIVGGVACNRGLRQAAAALGAHGLKVVAPPPFLCGDNAAMIAGLGSHLLEAGQTSPLTLNPRPSLRI